MNRSVFTPKRLIAATVVVAILLPFVWPSLFDTFFWFLFAGIIPGTNFALPAGMMALIYLVSLIALGGHFWRRGLYPGSPRLRRAQDEAAARIHPKPSRVFSRRRPKAATGRRPRVSSRLTG